MLDEDSSLSQGEYMDIPQVGTKRPFALDGVLRSSKTMAKEEVKRRSKKFRVEWMEEVHFKDWLQPHPTDETLCHCIACDINLRCGKSELEKHASGMKHSKRVEDMKADPAYRNPSDKILLPNIEPQDENGSTWMDVSAERRVEHASALMNGNENMGTQYQFPGASDQSLTEAVMKLIEFADGKMELSKRRMEMAETEHRYKMQILEKELQIKNMELQIKAAELKKVELDAVENRNLFQKDKLM